MTTAHRPTWNFAVASGTNPSGNQIVCQSTKVANRDAANFTTIKYREATQGTREERLSRREFQEELEKKEELAKEKREGKNYKTPADKARLELKGEIKPTDKSLEDNPFPEDADDDLAQSEKASDEENSDDDDEEEDTEELMRELAKIKKEREAEEEKARATAAKSDDRLRREEVFKANPLLVASDLSLKRKWDDDTIFKNQARTAPVQKLRFINDATRSDFHKRFLNKYVQLDTVYH